MVRLRWLLSGQDDWTREILFLKVLGELGVLADGLDQRYSVSSGSGGKGEYRVRYLFVVTAAILRCTASTAAFE